MRSIASTTAPIDTTWKQTYWLGRTVLKCPLEPLGLPGDPLETRPDLDRRDRDVHGRKRTLRGERLRPPGERQGRQHGHRRTSWQAPSPQDHVRDRFVRGSGRRRAGAPARTTRQARDGRPRLRPRVGTTCSGARVCTTGGSNVTLATGATSSSRTRTSTRHPGGSRGTARADGRPVEKAALLRSRYRSRARGGPRRGRSSSCSSSTHRYSVAGDARKRPVKAQSR